MKTCGWIIATVLRVTTTHILFQVDESESYQTLPKFSDLVGQTVLIQKKDKYWKSELGKGRKHLVNFNRTKEEITFVENLVYVLLISRQSLGPIRLIGTAAKEDLYRLLGRSPDVINTKYLVNIPFIKGSVRGTIEEIYDKLKQWFPGDPNVYLSHEKSEWFILVQDGELKETTMPLLLQKIG